MSKKVLIADGGDSDLRPPDQAEIVQSALELDAASMDLASPGSEIRLRDLAVLAAIAYARRTTRSPVSLPERWQSGWYLRRRLLT